MCGVLGITIREYKGKDYDLVRSLFQQSMIRGKHATGVSYVRDNQIHTISEPVSSEEFIKKHHPADWVNEDGNLYCIGHIRYSTSDLRYNQPFFNDDISVVHNGVITQEPKETWRNLYGYLTETANDSELILHALSDNKNPLLYFNPSSMSVCTLYSDKTLRAFRNESRPLYIYSDERMVIFTSTENIAKRSGVNNSQKAKMYRVYSVNNFEVSFEDVETNVEDLQ